MNAERILNENNTKCLLCGNDCREWITDTKDYFVKQGNSIGFSILYCDDCGLGYSAPPLKDEDLASYYPDTYEPHSKKSGLLKLLTEIKHHSDFKKLGGNSEDSLFEIGAGRGEFLKKAKDKGLFVSGIEPGETGVKLAQEEYGITLQKGFSSEIKFQKPFSIVVARYVVEHLNDAISTLEKVFKSGLKPGGLLFLKLPNLETWESSYFNKYWSGYDLPRHRIHFTKKGIERLLTQVGFTDIQVSSECVPNDIIHSCEHYNRYSENKNILISLFCCLPKIVQYPLAQCLALALKNKGTGRMNITARK